MKNALIRPMIMQVECHPYFPAETRKPYCDANEIRLQSWFPLGHGSPEMLSEPVLVQMAEKYGKSTVQIVIRWHLQMGFGLVPGSKSHAHIADNAKVFDFALTEEEMKLIETLNRHEPFYKVTEESLHRMAVTKCNFEE